jgi:hypothetical protein
MVAGAVCYRFAQYIAPVNITELGSHYITHRLNTEQSRKQILSTIYNSPVELGSRCVTHRLNTGTVRYRTDIVQDIEQPSLLYIYISVSTRI